MSATSGNGLPAPVREDGVIRCEVPLFIGANDVVVEVSDRADNSGSAGFRIVRTAADATRERHPGEHRHDRRTGRTTVQVHDAAGLPRETRRMGVHFNPSIGEMSNDGRHVFTAKAPGQGVAHGFRWGGASGQGF